MPLATMVAPARLETAAAAARTLNAALAAELELLAAYDFSIETGLLHAPALRIAREYRRQHEQHAVLLSQAVRKLGGKPAQAPGRYDFGADRLHDEEGVLRLVSRLEQGAVGTYLSAIPQFAANPDLSNVAARILADEAMHCAVLRQALGQAPVFMV
jgi:hypothetical protein